LLRLCFGFFRESVQTVQLGKPSVCGGFDVVDVQLEQGRHRGQPAHQFEGEGRSVKAEAVKDVEALALEVSGLLSILDGLPCERRHTVEASEDPDVTPAWLAFRHDDAFAQGVGGAACSSSVCTE